MHNALCTPGWHLGEGGLKLCDDGFSALGKRLRVAHAVDGGHDGDGIHLGIAEVLEEGTGGGG